MNHAVDLGTANAARYELRYRPLSKTGRGFAFPCDLQGHVVIDELSRQALANYLYARAMVGKELGWPLVERRLVDAA